MIIYSGTLPTSVGLRLYTQLENLSFRSNALFFLLVSLLYSFLHSQRVPVLHEPL